MMGHERDASPPSEDFRTSPDFAAVLDRLVEAAQAGDDALIGKILDERPEWRGALEEERAFLARIERTRPASPPALSLHTTVPDAVHELPMPLAQAWLAVLDAATTPARMEAAHFTCETYAVYLVAVAVGAYDASGEDDADVAASIQRLGRNGRPHVWLETMDTVCRWSTAPPRGPATGPRSPVLGRIHRRLEEEVEAESARKLLRWLERLNGNDPGRARPVTVRTFLDAVLAHHQAVAKRPGAMVRGTDAERTAEHLEAALADLLTTDSLLRGLACTYVRTIERISKDVFQHGVVDLRGTSPLNRRGGLLLTGRSLEPGRVYCNPPGGETPIPLHPFFIFQEGKTLRLTVSPERKGLSYSACLAGEGRIDRAVRPGGLGRIEALLIPRDRDERPPDRLLLAPGVKEVIGDFRILRQIGEGGMALVYLAEQRSIGREVALKVLHKSRLTSGFVERFRREGKAIGRLEHPNVVKVHSIGEDDGIPYLAMEYIPGDSLERLIRQSEGEEPGLPRAPGDRSTMETICRITREVALALDHAHQHGIAHRDVKPGNILLDEEGHAHLTDFGLAQERGKDSLTMTGDMVGTPHFLSPEQVAAKRIEVDHRTDIYSLGVTLYQMLTGTLPFMGETLEQILRQIALKEPTPPRRLNPRVPRDLETICLHAMEKDPDARYQSAFDMAEDLRAVTELRPILASRAGPVRRAWKLARRRPAVTVLATLFVVALLAWGLSTLHRMRQEAAQVEENLRLGRAMMEAGRESLALPYFQRVLELAPSEPEAKRAADRIRFMQQLERAYELAFDWDDPEDDTPLRQCLELLGRIERSGQDDGSVRLLKAQVLFRLGRIERARMQEALAFVQTLENTTVSPGIKLLKAAALEALDRPGAAALRQAAAGEAPEDDRDRMILAATCMAEGRWQEALEHYKAILKHADRNLEITAASQAARCCFWLRKYEDALEHLRLVERAQGRRPELLRRRAMYLYKMGDVATALRVLGDVIQRQADSAAIHMTRAHVLWEVRRFREALEDLNKAVALDPSFAPAYATRAQAHALVGDFAAAIQDANHALEIYPELQQARVLRAKFQLTLGTNLDARLERRAAMQAWNKAQADLEVVLEKQPRNAKALALRAQVYLRQKQFRFALEDAGQAIAIDPDLGQAQYVLGLIHYRIGDWDRALRHLNLAIERDPRFPGALDVRGHIRYERGLYKSALMDVNRALELEPSFVSALINRAWILLKLGRREEAETDVEKALERTRRPQAFLVRHVIRMMDQEWDAALSDCEAALALDPQLPETYLYLAQYYEKLVAEGIESAGQAHAHAVACYDECLRVVRDVPNRMLRGRVDAQREKAFLEASRAFLRGGEEPQGALALAIRGHAWMRKKKPEEALKDLELGIRESETGDAAVKPRKIEFLVAVNTLIELARLAELLREFDTAIELFRRVRKLDPEHPLALEGLRRLTER